VRVERVEASGAEGAQCAALHNRRDAAARLNSVIATLGERGSW